MTPLLTSVWIPLAFLLAPPPSADEPVLVEPASPTHAAQEAARYEGRLSVVPVDFRTVGSTAGSGWVSAWIEDGALRVEGTFEGTPTAATDAELRRGPPGVPGPVVAELDVQPDTAGAILGEIEGTRELEEALRSGHLYVLVRTEGNPEGEIRGWLVPPDFSESTTASRTSEASR